MQERFGRLREPADGMNAARVQFSFRRRTHIQQVFYGQPPRRSPIISGRDLRHRVRFFHVGGEFRKNFVPAHAHADGDADLLFHRRADALRDRPAAAEHPLRFRHVQPALVDAERLHAVGVPLVDFAHLLGYAKVGGKIGGELHEARTFLFCLPDHFSCLYARLFG